MSEILQQACAIEEDVRTWRRHFHANPELGMETENTAAYIEKVLAEIGITNVRRCGKTGVLALIEGAKPGRCIGLRGDIDALPVQERNDLPYRSTVDGVMHACAHDVHAACLLGAAKLLYNRRNELSGSVKLFFQPGEEVLSGAVAMIEDGAMENPKVDAIYMIHGYTETEAGTIGLRKGPALASAQPIKITVKGSQGHAARPHACVDSILIASNIVSNLQSIVARELSPLEPGVVTIGTIHGGTVSNIIPEYTYLEGTVRTFSKETSKHILDSIKRIAENTATTFRGTATLEAGFGIPPIINSDEMYTKLHALFCKTFGKEKVIDIPQPVMGGDDFSLFMDHAPGAHIRLGVAVKDAYNAPLHSPDFYVDESCLPYGVAILASVALDELGE